MNTDTVGLYVNSVGMLQISQWRRMSGHALRINMMEEVEKLNLIEKLSEYIQDFNPARMHRVFREHV